MHLLQTIPDVITKWVGSTSSLVVHTLFFIGSFLCHLIFGWDYDFILLVLTTVVSLEAIYLNIFIQRAVNQQSIRLHEVEDTLDEVEDTLDEVEDSIDEVEESLADAEEDIADISDETVKKLEEPLAEVLKEMRQILAEFSAVTLKEKAEPKKPAAKK